MPTTADAAAASVDHHGLTGLPSVQAYFAAQEEG
jgi:hypothetical protein